MEESANTQLRDKTIAHSIYLQRYYSSTSKKVMDLLRETEKDLVRQLKTLDLDNQMTIPQIDARLESVRAILNEGYTLAGKELITNMNDAAEYEQEWQIKATNESTPVVLDMVAVAPVTLFAAIESKPLEGKVIKEWIDKLDQDSYTRIQDAVRMGLVEGQSYNDVVKRITGTKALQYTDGVMALNDRQAQALVSTAMAHATNTARDEFYQENADLYKGVQWVSTLDQRTSSICQARDGKVYPLDTGIRPPAHFRCRSAMVPILKSWQALGLKNPDGRTRASMDGQVAQTETYQSWLKKKPEAFQDEVLGQERAKLFRDGTPLDRFVDDSGHRYTIDELKKKENIKIPDIKSVKAFVPAKSMAEAKDRMMALGVKNADINRFSEPHYNKMLEVIENIPKKAIPSIITDKIGYESVTGMKIKRKQTEWMGLSLTNEIINKETFKYSTERVVVINNKGFSTPSKMTARKAEYNDFYSSKKDGNKWYFNEFDGSTHYHETGHIYDNGRISNKQEWIDITDKWHKESKVDLLKVTTGEWSGKNGSEAFAEAFASYFGNNKIGLPSYVIKYFDENIK